jgi:RNA polymerase sigma-70 factor (ECF subfamily)
MDRPGAANDAPSLETTLELLRRAKIGDPLALGEVCERYRPRLRQWAHGRLPAYARTLVDTDDLIQKVLLKTIRNLDGFEAEHADGFNHYLRVTVQNAVRDEIRRARRQPTRVALDPDRAGDDRSPLEAAIERDRHRRYEAALTQLSTAEREAIIARIEFGFTHRELAAALGKGTSDAARKACRSAIMKLLALMQQPPHEAS